MSSTLKTDVSEFTLEELKYNWIISNWLSLKHNENKIIKETYSISTCSPILTKWKIGLLPDPLKKNEVIFTWTLLELEKSMSSVQASIKFSVIDCGDNRKMYTSRKNRFVKVDEVNLLTEGNGIPILEDWRPGYFLDNYGRLHVNVKLTFILPNPPTKKNLAEAALQKDSFAKYQENQSALLNDSATSDIKIVASDGVEIMAHKVMLQAQCPVFASMFRSQFAETTDGIIKIEDLCGKVVQILLHFFYTGELHASWCDPDVIVEFTYSAGKYQLTHILNMLDNVLGDHDNGEDCQNDVLLLNIINKLSLKNAEKKLLDRIKKNVSKCMTATGILMMFDIKVDKNLLEKEDTEAIVEIWEETLLELDEGQRNAGRLDILLLHYAEKKRLKKLELELLKRINFTIQNFETADELFAIFKNVSTD